MTEKQYLEAVANALAEAAPYVDDLNLLYTQQETERRLAALKAQEDNIKSDHWEEITMSNPIEQSIAALEQKIEKYEGQIVEWQEEIDRLDGKSNPLPSELREKICKLMGVFPEELKYNLPNTFGNREMDEMLELFEQEYQRRIKAAKPKEWVLSDLLEGYDLGINRYEHNLKQLSEGDNHARSK